MGLGPAVYKAGLFPEVTYVTYVAYRAGLFPEAAADGSLETPISLNAAAARGEYMVLNDAGCPRLRQLFQQVAYVTCVTRFAYVVSVTALPTGHGAVDGQSGRVAGETRQEEPRSHLAGSVRCERLPGRSA